MTRFRSTEKLLIISGIILFLLGLIQGALIPAFENPRMALSGHLTAVQCGTALVAFSIVSLSTKWSVGVLRLTNMGLASGFGFIWIGITLAALSGASRALPHAGKGYQATPSLEAIVSLLVLLGGGLSIVATCALLMGLFRKSDVP